MSLRDAWFGVLLCGFSLALVPKAEAASLLTPYNVIVSGNFTDSSDVGGGLAVGGVATLGTLSIADDMNGEALSAFPSNTTFTAAGGASGGEVGAGNYYYAGTDATFYNNGSGTRDSSNPMTVSMTPFAALSNTWSLDAATGGDGCTAAGGVTTCTVSHTGLNIIDLTAAQAAEIGAGQQLDINGVSSTDWVVINVAGTSDSLSGDMYVDGKGNNGDNSPTGAEDVAFNFYKATSLTLGGSSMGSVLAAGADVTGDGGQFVGSLVATSFNAGSDCGGTEFHNFIFQGGATPEPAPVAFVGAGLIALALYCKRRRATSPEAEDETEA